jgi:hypothetical protein
MYYPPENDQYASELFFAGHRVKSGRYRDLERGREVILAKDDFLPASLDGTVACYVRIKSSERRTACRGSGACGASASRVALQLNKADEDFE